MSPRAERPPLPEGPYLIVGLARSGVAAARMLRAHGDVIGTDSGHPDVPDDLEAVLGGDGLDLLDRAGCVVKSPGVPAEAPVIAAARERGLPVLGELELAWRLLPNRFVAVTGTNGKTTTVELLGAIWRAAGLPVAVAGNVGTPLSSLPGEVDPDATIVCEVSSFQAEDASGFAPDVGVLLNLDARPPRPPRELRGLPRGQAEPVRPPDAGPGRDRARLDRRCPGTRGACRRPRTCRCPRTRSACAAPTTSRTRGPRPPRRSRRVSRQARSREALRSFAGVPHRLEEVATLDGVLYVNDSKATNVSSAARAIESFFAGVHLILGGSLKGGGFEELREPVAERCHACYLIGEAADRLAADLAEAGVPLRRSGDLETAVAQARAAAKPGEVVLLSPACASYDQFRDYEQRGERFRALISAE